MSTTHLTNGHGAHTEDGYVSGVLAYAHRSADRMVPPDTRRKAYDDVSSFAASRPILSAFLLAQLLFSILPVLLFSTFVVSTAATAFTAAGLFSLFWTAVAFAVLVPALLLAGAGALLVGAWFVAGFVVARWLYRRLSLAAKSDHQANTSNYGHKSYAEVVKQGEGATGEEEDVKQPS